MDTKRTIYLAGGCFWGMEKLMQSLYGVIDVTSGYANGTGEADASYPIVCTGTTGFRETVRVTYDPVKTNIDNLLSAFFTVIDPTAVNRQGNDQGTQYQSGIYWADDATKEEVLNISEKYRKQIPGFAVEIKPLSNFFSAEEYHQHYLDKHPDGYCHIPRNLIARLSEESRNQATSARDPESLKETLSPMAYHVTQEEGTEPPFSSPLWDATEPGLYVDVTTGVPLFTSRDKYHSSCGWPSFTKPVQQDAVVEKEDDRFGMIRTEVRSARGNAHLGHVFQDDPESPTGVRYCINGAALRFIPVDKLEEKGYGRYRSLFS
jgi:peptide methionine sulfoxide reductase msrA/msrB